MVKEGESAWTRAESPRRLAGRAPADRPGAAALPPRPPDSVERRRGGKFEDNVNAYFDQAGGVCGHNKGLLEMILACNSVYSFSLPCGQAAGQIDVGYALRAGEVV